MVKEAVPGEGEDAESSAESAGRRVPRHRAAAEQGDMGLFRILAGKIPQILLILLILFILVFQNPVVIVPAGNKGILLNFGAVSGVLPEGLNFRIPFAQGVQMFEVRTQKYETDATAASMDMQDVYTTVALNYHPDSSQVDTIYRTLGMDYASKVIAPAIQEATKAATSQYKAEDLIDKRTIVRDGINKLLTERLSRYGIIVETVSITNFRFSAQYTQAIEQKVTSQQTKLNEEQILQIKEIQAKQALAVAHGEANARIAMASADANATIVKADAEARAIEMISKKLAQEPRYLDYMRTQRWDGRLPTTVAGGVVPFINLSN
jgi:prohibitin 2